MVSDATVSGTAMALDELFQVRFQCLAPPLGSFRQRTHCISLEMKGHVCHRDYPSFVVGRCRNYTAKKRCGRAKRSSHRGCEKNGTGSERTDVCPVFSLSSEVPVPIFHSLFAFRDVVSSPFGIPEEWRWGSLTTCLANGRGVAKPPAQHPAQWPSKIEKLEQRAEHQKEKADALEPQLAEVYGTIADMDKREKELREQMLEP